MTSPARARILIVDDHPIVRLGIRQMISADPRLTICAECESADEALLQVTPEDSRPDLAIVDLSLQGGVGGLSLIRALHERAPDLPVLVLSLHDELLFAERALRAGARGYIMKQEAINLLVSAIHHVLSGAIYVSERIAQDVLRRVGQDVHTPRSNLDALTAREIEVFEMIGRGLNTTAIARRLAVSVKTIETYRSNIKAKLNLKDGAELIRYAASWIERL